MWVLVLSQGQLAWLGFARGKVIKIYFMVCVNLSLSLIEEEDVCLWVEEVGE
jgi:hypothetical protein